VPAQYSPHILVYLIINKVIIVLVISKSISQDTKLTCKSLRPSSTPYHVCFELRSSLRLLSVVLVIHGIARPFMRKNLTPKPWALFGIDSKLSFFKNLNFFKSFILYFYTVLICSNKFLKINIILIYFKIKINRNYNIKKKFQYYSIFSLYNHYNIKKKPSNLFGIVIMVIF
jgi:hypothetical protein